MTRVLAVDFGERRIGLAVSDPSGTIAQPLPTLRRRAGKRPPTAAIVELVQSHGVEEIVIGLPLALSGDDTDWTREVRRFADILATRTRLSVSLADERMTSVIAERAIRSLGLKKSAREQKERVDAGAALVILQAYLDRRNRKAES